MPSHRSRRRTCIPDRSGTSRPEPGGPASWRFRRDGSGSAIHCSGRLHVPHGSRARNSEHERKQQRHRHHEDLLPASALPTTPRLTIPPALPKCAPYCAVQVARVDPWAASLSQGRCRLGHLWASRQVALSLPNTRHVAARFGLEAAWLPMRLRNSFAIRGWFSNTLRAVDYEIARLASPNLRMRAAPTVQCCSGVGA
jgi:hypothetical protein